MLTTFGRRLAAIRKDRGLTQAELAAAVGKSRQTINLWERGRAIDIRTGDAERCARALECNRRDLFAPLEAPLPLPASSWPRRKQRVVRRPDKPSPPDEVERLEALLFEVLRRLVRYEPDAVDLLDRVTAPSGSVSDGRRAA